MSKVSRFVSGWGFVLVAGFGLLLMQGSDLPKSTRPAAVNSISSPEKAAAAWARLTANWGNLPLRFEKNFGQSDARVQYVARGGGFNVMLADANAYFVLEGRPAAAAPARRQPMERLREARRRAEARVAMGMEMKGANPSPAVEPLDALETRSNYLIGNDPAQWHSNILNYARVRYRNVYPGVDVIYYGREKQLEYDFVVAPGNDPGKIRLRFSGADAVAANGDGDLVLRVGGRELVQRRPVAFQMAGDARRAVEARYDVRGNEVGFALGQYDASKPLTIDPVLVWSTYFGGSGDETAFGIAVDGAGSVYVTGVTSSANLLTTAGVVQAAKNGALEDAYVVKLNAAGTAITYCTYLGGTDYDEGDTIAVDGAQRAYIGGFTVSANFPGTAGHAQAVNHGLATTGNGFIAKLNAAGSAIMFATYLGGVGPDGVNDLAIDAGNNVYATGFTMSTVGGMGPGKFPITAGVLQPAFGGTSGGNTGDAFVTKVAANGNSFLYSTYLGGARDDQGWGIRVDAANNAYVAGETQSANFPTTGGAVQPARPAKLPDRAYGGWIAEVNPTATALVFSTYFGGNGNDHIFGLARNAASANLYVTGSTTSTNLPVSAGALQPVYAGPAPGGFGDAFVGALNSTGTAYVYLTYLGGSGEDAGSQIAVDAADFAYVAGFTTSMNFPVSAAATQTTLNGAQNAWVAKIRPGGTLIIHSSYLGGSGTDTTFGVAIDGPPARSVYFAGNTTSVNFPIKPVGAVQPAFGGGALDNFVSRYDMRAPTANFAPATLSFGPQMVGTMSASMGIVLKNIGNANMTVTAINVVGDFTAALACGGLPRNIGAGVSCTINVFFKPTAMGVRLGTITLTDTAPGSPHVLMVMGTGT